MTHIVSDGLTLAQATGQRILYGAGAVAGGIREEVDAVRRHGEPAAHARRRPAWQMHLIEMVASLAGALAAFVVSRLVRERLHRAGR